MKKIIFLALLLPLFAFSQPIAQKKGKVMKKAFFEKQVIKSNNTFLSSHLHT